MNAPDLKPLSAQLVMTPEMAADLARETGALDLARQYVIDGPEMAQAANSELKDIKRRLKLVEDWRERFIEPARMMVNTANEFFNPARQSLTAAEAHLKNALLGYQKKEQERIDAERRTHEDAERKVRQEAEQRAAAERARAEEQAREARAKAAAAEEAKRKAAEDAERLRREGNAKAAAEAEARARAAAAEEAKQQEKAVAAIENGEAKATAAQLEGAIVAQAAPPVQEQTKLTGFGSRENYVPEFKPGMDEDKVKELIVAAIAGIEALPAARRDLLGTLSLDMKSLTRIAKAQKQHFNVPGMVARDKPVATSRG